MNVWQPTDQISVRLEAQQWNVVLGALGETAWRLADPVIRAIQGQVQPPPEPPPHAFTNGAIVEDEAERAPLA